MDPRPMGDAHRLLLQSFMSKGIIDAKQTKQLYKLACTRYEYACNDLADFVITINENIKPIHLEIKKAIAEEDGRQSYCLVNTKDTEFTRMAASDYSASQLDIFKRLIEKIVEADTGTVSSIEALNLPDLDPLIKVSKRDTESLYEKLQEQQWIGKNSDGHYFLTARAILELEHYIREQYPNLASNCEMCRKLVLQGQSCVNCDVKIHLKCAAKCFDKSDSPQCPSSHCKAPWPHAIPCQGRDLPAPSQVAPSQAASQPSSSRDTRKRKLRN